MGRLRYLLTVKTENSCLFYSKITCVFRGTVFYAVQDFLSFALVYSESSFCSKERCITHFTVDSPLKRLYAAVRLNQIGIAVSPQRNSNLKTKRAVVVLNEKKAEWEKLCKYKLIAVEENGLCF